VKYMNEHQGCVPF